MTENELLNSFCHLFLLQWLLRLLEILEDVKNVRCWSAGWSNLSITNWTIIVACVCVWSQTGPVSVSVWPQCAIFNTAVHAISHNTQTHTHTCFSLSYLSFSRYPLFVLLVWPISGLCYLIHAEDDSHIVIWGRRWRRNPPTPHLSLANTYRHTSIIQHLRLLPSAISFLPMLVQLANLITTAQSSCTWKEWWKLLFECCPHTAVIWPFTWLLEDGFVIKWM